MGEKNQKWDKNQKGIINIKDTLNSMNKEIKTNWDLSNFYSNINDDKIKNDLKQYEKNIEKFISRYKGKIKKFNEEDFLKYFKEKFELNKIINKISLYYFYNSSLDTQNQEIIKKENELDNFLTEISNKLLFISQEFKEIGYDKLIEFSKSKKLEKYSNYFYQKAISIKYLLNEKEERILNLKENSGSSAFNNLYEELTNSFIFKIEIGGELKEMTDAEIRALRTSSNPEIRKKANESIRKIYNDKKVQITLGNIYSAIVKDWISEIKIRGFSNNVLEQRNLSEEMDNETIETLINEVQKVYPLYQKYLKLKAKQLGVEKINNYDLLAPISKEEKEINFEKGLEIYLDMIKKFDEEFYNYSIDMFEKGRVDVFPNKGKRGGAFAQYIKGFESFVLLNYTNKLRDVSTLAHELGHAIHGHLSQIQEEEVFESPLSLAETASIFNELLLAEDIKKELNEKEKLDFLEKRLEDIFATIFRQIQYISFEKRIHESFLNNKELTYIDFNKIWREEQLKMSGEIVKWDLVAEEESSWSMIPHIFRTPFYCYTYAFGNILSFSLYNLYKNEGKEFIKKYKEILSSGGSKKPFDLLIQYGIDINSKEFYRNGIKEIENILNEFEELVNQ